MMPSTVVAPLLNVNEPTALVVSVLVRVGDAVERDQPLVLLETTKAAAEVAAPVRGFVRQLLVRPGDRVEAGAALALITATADEPLPEATTADPASGGLPPGLKLTRPALALARQLGLDLSTLPTDVIITEDVVRRTHESLQPDQELSLGPVDGASCVLVGGGGHGRKLIDLVRLGGTLRFVGALDDGLASGSQVAHIPVLGGLRLLASIVRSGVTLAVNGMGGVPDPENRARFAARIAEAGLHLPALVHPSATLDPSVTLDDDAQVFGRAFIEAGTRIERGAVINSGAIISHDCAIGSYTHVAPGAIIAGGVSVGRQSLIGMGATIAMRLRVGANVRIGNNATVTDHVPDGVIVPAGAVWPAR